MSSDYKHTEILRETRIKGIKNAVLSVWRESGELILNKLIRPERAASSQPGAESLQPFQGARYGNSLNSCYLNNAMHVISRHHVCRRGFICCRLYVRHLPFTYSLLYYLLFCLQFSTDIFCLPKGVLSCSKRSPLGS